MPGLLIIGLDAFDVVAGLGIDAYGVAGFDEHGHIQRCTCFEGHYFVAALGRVAAGIWRSLGDLELHLNRDLHLHRLIVEPTDFHLDVALEVLAGIANPLLVDRESLRFVAHFMEEPLAVALVDEYRRS